MRSICNFIVFPGSLYLYVSSEKNLELSIDFTVGESADKDWKKNAFFEKND